MIVSFLFEEVCLYSSVGSFIISIYKVDFTGLGQNFGVPDKTTNLWCLGGDGGAWFIHRLVFFLINIIFGIIDFVAGEETCSPKDLY